MGILDTSKPRSIPTCFDSSFYLQSVDKLYHSHLEDQIMEVTIPEDQIMEVTIPEDQIMEVTIPADQLMEVTIPADQIMEVIIPADQIMEVTFPELEAMGTGMEMLEMEMGIIMLEAIMVMETMVITMAMEIQEVMDLAMENNDKLFLRLNNCLFINF